jgi:hypothetical protein
MLRFVQRRVVKPLLDLLRMGATPERLAWSIAAGVLIGINPVLGSTTVLAIAVASVFRLNYVASQVGNHLVYPLELLLFPDQGWLFAVRHTWAQAWAARAAVRREAASVADNQVALDMGVARAGGMGVCHSGPDAAAGHGAEAAVTEDAGASAS